MSRRRPGRVKLIIAAAPAVPPRPKHDTSSHDVQRKRQGQLRKVQDLEFSRECGQPVGVVRSEEQWVEQLVQGPPRTGIPAPSMGLGCPWRIGRLGRRGGLISGALALGDRKQGLQRPKGITWVSPGTLLRLRFHFDVGADVGSVVGVYALYDFCPPPPMGALG
jgi:hypothetical protein